jgi:hypothetical protein
LRTARRQRLNVGAFITLTLKDLGAQRGLALGLFAVRQRGVVIGNFVDLLFQLGDELIAQKSGQYAQGVWHRVRRKCGAAVAAEHLTLDVQLGEPDLMAVFDKVQAFRFAGRRKRLDLFSCQAFRFAAR